MFGTITLDESIDLQKQRLAEANLEYFTDAKGLICLRTLDTKDEVEVVNAYLQSILEDKCVCGYCARKGIA